MESPAEIIYKQCPRSLFLLNTYDRPSPILFGRKIPARFEEALTSTAPGAAAALNTTTGKCMDAFDTFT